MSNEITNDNGELDAGKLFNKLSVLNCDLEEATKKALDILNMSTTTGRGLLRKVDPDKVSALSESVYEQSVCMKELYDIQLQAMQLSVGSYDALKLVNKELEKAMERGFASSGSQNIDLFNKTQDQIKRVATFAKNYADNLDELKKEIKDEEKKILYDYAKKESVEELKDEVDKIGRISDKVDGIENDINKISDTLDDMVKKGDLSKYAKATDIKNELKEYAAKNDLKKIQSSLKEYIKEEDVEKKIDEAINKLEDDLKNTKEELKELSENNSDPLKQLDDKMKVFSEKSEKEIKRINELFDNKSNKIENEINSIIEKNLKPKINPLPIISIIIGSIALILALVSIIKIL